MYCTVISYVDLILLIHRTQMAYINQLKGKTDVSLQIYNQVLKSIKSKWVAIMLIIDIRLF